MTTIAQALALAVQHHQAGNLQQAEQIYRQILQVDANQADALHFLGLIAHQVGKNDIAIDYITKAISSNNTNPAFYSNLGIAYLALGEFDARSPASRRRCGFSRTLPGRTTAWGMHLRGRGSWKKP